MRPQQRPTVLAIAVFVAFVGAYAWPSAQAHAKKTLGVEDYTKWRSIQGEQISGDGNWVTYVLQLTNTPTAEAKPVLHVLNLQSNEDVSVANATNGTFSPDAKWVAYLVDPNPGRGGRGRASAEGTDAPPAPPEGDAAWQDIQSTTFNAASTHLVLRRRPATAQGGRGNSAGAEPPQGQQPAGEAGRGGSAPAGPRGVDTILVDLKTGRHQLLADVGDIAFNKQGDLLAYTVDAAVKDGNGLFLLDTVNNRMTTLDSDAKVYNRLTWSEDGSALAVLKGVEVDKRRERDNVLVAFTNLAKPPVVLDRTRAQDFPAGAVISDRTAMTWSDDNKRVFRHQRTNGRARCQRAHKHGRSRERRHLQYRRRAYSVGADDPRRAGSQRHVQTGVRRLSRQVREAG
jgi:hypothetical protein